MSSSPGISAPSGQAAARPALTSGDWKRLNRLLAQALEVDTGHRGEWITTLPESDRDLLPLLERLLEQASTAEASETAGAMPRLRSEALRPPTSAPAPRSDERPGDQIGPYRLLRELGTRRHGHRLAGRTRRRRIERQVALKLPRAEWTDRGLADRMARERAVLAALNHPNIAHLLDAGWAGDGRPYLALEYVEGEPIDAWCRRRQLAPAERTRLFVDVVRAVAFAHGKLVIHRDLKPSNVFVTAEGRVKLLDFGIAKLLSAGESLTEETALTQFSGRALTLNYAAPEQILGQPIWHRGRHVFAGRDAVRTAERRAALPARARLTRRAGRGDRQRRAAGCGARGGAGDRPDVGERAAGVPGWEGSYQRREAVELDAALAVAWAQVRWPACHLTKASASAVM